MGSAGAGEEATVASDPGDAATIGSTAVQEVVGEGDAVPGDDVVETNQREKAPARAFGVGDADGVAVEVEAGSRGGGVESAEEFSHPRLLLFGG